MPTVKPTAAMVPFVGYHPTFGCDDDKPLQTLRHLQHGMGRFTVQLKVSLRSLTQRLGVQEATCK